MIKNEEIKHNSTNFSRIKTIELLRPNYLLRLLFLIINDPRNIFFKYAPSRLFYGVILLSTILSSGFAQNITTDRYKIAIYVDGDYPGEQKQIYANLLSGFSSRYVVLQPSIMDAYFKQNRISGRDIKKNAFTILPQMSKDLIKSGNPIDVTVYCTVTSVTSESSTKSNNESVHWSGTIMATVYYMDIASGRLNPKQLVGSKGSGLGSFGVFLGTKGMTKEKAIEEAGKDLSGKIISEFVDNFPLQAQVIAKSAQHILLNIGSKSGIRKKSRFDIFNGDKREGSALVYSTSERTTRAFLYKGENNVDIGMSAIEKIRDISTPDEPEDVIDIERQEESYTAVRKISIPELNSIAILCSEDTYWLASQNKLFLHSPSGVRQLGEHQKIITDMVKSSDNRYIITTGLDGDIKIWAASDGRLAKITGMQTPARHLAISPSGQMFASAHENNLVHLWSLPAGERLKTIDNLKKPATSLVFSPDEKNLAIASDKKVIIQNLSADKPAFQLKGHEDRIRSMIYNHKGNILISASDDASIRVWDLLNQSSTKVLISHTNPVTTIKLSPDGCFALTAGAGQVVRIWDTSTWLVIANFKAADEEIHSLCFSSDGTKIMTGSFDGYLRLWDLKQIPQIAERLALPAALTTEVVFDDTKATFPNNTLDGSENADLILKTSNSGDGTGYGVIVQLESDNPTAIIQSEVALGDIAPKSVKQTIVPIKAQLTAVDGHAIVSIQTKEKRGYDARPIQLQIPVKHLDKPVLAFTHFLINDGATGKANGNGNGIAENGETVEITAFIRNEGTGQSLNTTAMLTAADKSLEITKGEEQIGTILSGETKQATMVLHIPRTYSGTQMLLSFKAQDALGASQAMKEHILAMTSRAPVLVVESSFLNKQGIQVNEVENGGEYVLELRVRNEGELNAKAVSAAITSQEASGLTLAPVNLGDIAAGSSSAPTNLSFYLPRNYSAGPPKFLLQIRQSDFSDLVQKIDIPFNHKSPNLVLRDIITTSDGDSEIRQGENIYIDLVIENQGGLNAEEVIVDIEFNHPGIDLRERTKDLGRIPAGGSSLSNRFSLLVKTGAAVGPLNGTLRIRQRDGFPGIEKAYDLNILPISAQVVTITGKEEMPTTAPASALRANTPPNVLISPKNVSAENKSSERIITLEIVIQDDKAMLSAEPEIRVNGRPQAKELGLRGIDLQARETQENDRKIRLFRRVELTEGLNNIEVRLYDADNELGFDKVQVEYLTDSSNIYALVIGVGDYQDGNIEKLKYTASDAQSFHDFLATPQGGGLGSDHIRLLLNREATRENILGGLEWIASRSQENDMIIIYMAMHGLVERNEFYFLGHDAQLDKLYATGVKRAEMEIPLQHMRSNKIVWFMDACHSGSLGKDPEIAMRANRASTTNRLLGEIAKSRNGLAKFMSSQATEYSQEAPKWGGGHGVFTYFLVKGLRGEADRNSDTKVTLSELYDYVSRQVSEATNGEQNPNLGDGEYDRTLPLAVTR